MKKPYVASLDQVKISREDEYGVIEYVEPNVWTTHLRIGPNVQRMADQQILDEHNPVLRIEEQARLEYEHIATEEAPLIHNGQVKRLGLTFYRPSEFHWSTTAD